VLNKLVVSVFFSLSFLIYLVSFSSNITAENASVTASITGKRFRYVNTEDEFRLHMESHIVRVQILAMYIYRNFPEHFRHLTPELIKAFLRVHDQSKVNQTISFLIKHNLLRFDKTILTMLHKGYGNEDPNYFEKYLKAVVDLLNGIDNDIRTELFTYRGLLLRDGVISVTGEELLFLEKLSDNSDRRLDPVAMEEFGRENHEAASRNSVLFNKNHVGRLILNHLESPSPTKPGLTVYESLVEGFTFEHMKVNRHLAACLSAQHRYLSPHYR